ncbi:MAG: GNAT family N-acetyltransferase [Ignavibacteriae bacterium]|nr:GNAT family N-acetyltransferase [Ignavibacteriota bacterium]NOG97939.1 GNAT family N-acetyltransferase [Ignavibacteriota bacterium]
MLDIKKITSDNEFDNNLTREKFIDFLHKHLGEFGDPKKDIDRSIDYAFSGAEGKGGFLLAAYYEKKLVGALVINKTGMDGYIPENILVYVAVDGSYRNKGFGREIVEKAFMLADGNVKLHVEYDNPAKRLYERVGMTNKYAEMRYIKGNKK